MENTPPRAEPGPPGPDRLLSLTVLALLLPSGSLLVETAQPLVGWSDEGTWGTLAGIVEFAGIAVGLILALLTLFLAVEGRGRRKDTRVTWIAVAAAASSLILVLHIAFRHSALL